jgi:hypothetical protein
MLPYERKLFSILPKFDEEDDFLRSLRGNIKANVLLSLNDADHLDDYHIFARKCKAGIRWATLRGTTVHFILDKLNLRKVVLKETVMHNGRKGCITASELRWIYRNRFDPYVMRCVQFWLNGEPVSPPWTYAFQIASHTQESVSEIWKLYQPKIKNIPDIVIIDDTCP